MFFSKGELNPELVYYCLEKKNKDNKNRGYKFKQNRMENLNKTERKLQKC